MTEPSGQDVSPETQGLSSGSEQMTRSIPLALWTTFAGHLLALIAAVTGSVPSSTAIIAAIACSVIATTALTELAPQDARVRGAVTALTAGHGIAAVILLAGLAPSVPWSVPLTGLAAAVAVAVACLAAVAHSSTVTGHPRPLTLAPRVAAIALVAQALLQRWAASATGLSMPLRATIFLSIAALGVALLACLSIIALRVRPRWAIAGLLAWTVGWVANTVDVSSLILSSLGGPVPMGPQQLRQLDAELVQILVTVGGLAIGAGLVTSIRDVRFRHSAIVLLAGYAVFGVIAAVAEHRIALATDFPTIAALRKNRDLADAIQAFAMAGVLWLYWRRVAASNRPRDTTDRW
jgi:hypothetical protein